MRPSSAVHRLHQRDPNGPARPQTAQRSAHPRVDRVLVSAEIDHSHAVMVGLWLSAGPFVAGPAWFLLGPALAVALLVFVGTAPIVWLVRRVGRRERRLVDGLPDLVDIVSRSLRAGLSLPQAVLEAATTAPSPAREELSRLVSDVRGGHSLPTAISMWVQRQGISEVRVVGAAIAVAASNEAGATRALDGVSQSLRDRRALDAEITALTAQSAASTRAMVGLPAAFLALDAFAGRHALGYLFAQPLGRLCLVVALCLEVLGWWWMRSIVKACSR